MNRAETDAYVVYCDVCGRITGCVTCATEDDSTTLREDRERILREWSLRDLVPEIVPIDEVRTAEWCSGCETPVAAARRGAFEEAAEICDERAQKYRAFAKKIEGVSAGQKELCKIRAETSDGNAAAIRERAKEDYAEREA